MAKRFYQFEVEVRPDFDLPDYTGLEIERPVRDISDEVQGFHFSKPIPPQDLLPFAGKRFSVPA